MAAHWGGRNIRFPIGLSYKFSYKLSYEFSHKYSQRNRPIYDDVAGANYSRLARK